MIDQPIVILTHDLTKRFKKLTAVDNLNMQVHRGEVFGFLGPKGAGKTTAIGLLLGLLRPTAGTAEVMGRDIRRQPARALRRVGALVEAAFYPYLSAQDNLWVMAQMSGGGVSRRRIDEMLELVGLANRAGDKFKTFSTGMKQRLGLAAALVHDPEVLILDEPTHGLDPAGMLQIRDLIRHLSREQGKTVFLSSHLLHEVEQVCDRVLILNRGKTIAAGRVDEIIQQGGRIEIRVNRPERAREALRALDWVDEVSLRDEVLYVAAPPERAAALTAALAARELYPHGIKIAERSLESFFLDVTAGGQDA